MSTHEMPPSDQPPQRFGMLNQPPNGEYPACPQCQRRMTIRSISPVLFATGIDDVVYGCEDCGTEVKKTVNRA